MSLRHLGEESGIIEVVVEIQLNLEYRVIKAYKNGIRETWFIDEFGCTSAFMFGEQLNTLQECHGRQSLWLVLLN